MYKGDNLMNLDGFSLIDDQKKDIYSYMNEFPDDKDFEKAVKKYAKPLKDYQELLNLERTVRITYRNRIQAANRLLQTEAFLQGINIYYSCISVVLSVLSLLSSSREVSVWATIISAILAVSIVYLNAQKYGSRSQELKTNYIALHRLLYKIYESVASNEATLANLTTEYCDLLQTSENHTDLDYLRQKTRQGEKLYPSEKFCYYLSVVWRYCIKIDLVIFPIGLFVFFFVRGDFKGILY